MRSTTKQSIDIDGKQNEIIENCRSFSHSKDLHIEGEFDRQGKFSFSVVSPKGTCLKSTSHPDVTDALNELLSMSSTFRKLMTRSPYDNAERGNNDAVNDRSSHSSSSSSSRSSSRSSSLSSSRSSSLSSSRSTSCSDTEEEDDSDGEDKNEAGSVHTGQKGRLGNKRAGNATSDAPEITGLNAQDLARGRPCGPRAQGPAQGPNNNNHGASGAGRGPQPKPARPLPPPPGPRANYPNAPAQGQGSARMPPPRHEPPSNQKATPPVNRAKKVTFDKKNETKDKTDNNNNNNTAHGENKNPPLNRTVAISRPPAVGPYRICFVGENTNNPNKHFHDAPMTFSGAVTRDAVLREAENHVKKFPGYFDDWIDLSYGPFTSSLLRVDMPFVPRRWEGTNKSMMVQANRHLLDFSDVFDNWTDEWREAGREELFVPCFEIYVRHEKSNT